MAMLSGLSHLTHLTLQGPEVVDTQLLSTIAATLGGSSRAGGRAGSGSSSGGGGGGGGGGHSVGIHDGAASWGPGAPHLHAAGHVSMHNHGHESGSHGSAGTGITTSAQGSVGHGECSHMGSTSHRGGSTVGSGGLRALSLLDVQVMVDVNWGVLQGCPNLRSLTLTTPEDDLCDMQWRGMEALTSLEVRGGVWVHVS